MNTAKKSSVLDGPMSQSGETSEKSKEQKSLNGAEQLTLFQVDSLVRISVSQKSQTEKDLGGGAADCGRKCLGLFAKLDRDTSLWRTSQHSLTDGLELYSQTWPVAGTMRNGNVYRLQPLVQRTLEIESGLWRTPDANMDRGTRTKENLSGRLKRGMPLNLNDQVSAIGYGLLEPPKGFGKRMKETGGKLNPMWAEWLMNVPEGWTDLLRSGTVGTFYPLDGSEKE